VNPAGSALFLDCGMRGRRRSEPDAFEAVRLMVLAGRESGPAILPQAFSDQRLFPDGMMHGHSATLLAEPLPPAK
jgi:hypothetical protein